MQLIIYVILQRAKQAAYFKTLNVLPTRSIPDLHLRVREFSPTSKKSDCFLPSPHLSLYILRLMLYFHNTGKIWEIF
jgi:hypothetical protein